MAGPADVRVFTDRRPIGADRMIVRRCAEWLLRNVAVLEGAELTWTVGEGDDAVTHTEWPVVNAYDSWGRSRRGRMRWRRGGHAPRSSRASIPGAMATALHHYGDGVLCLACRRGYTLEEYATLTKVLARRFGQDADEPLVHPCHWCHRGYAVAPGYTRSDAVTSADGDAAAFGSPGRSVSLIEDAG